jgi:hypothetical protein
VNIRLAWAVNDPYIEVSTYTGAGKEIYATDDMNALHAVTLFEVSIYYCYFKLLLLLLLLKINLEHALS